MIRLYNTLTRQKEEFRPIVPGKVGLYTCGPTVYDYAHIGNLRTYIFEDILRRILEYNGLEVLHVMNITDVGHLVSEGDEGEDKMLVGAAREHKSPWEIAKFYTEAFFDDCRALNILPPKIVCRATDHIPEMIAATQRLVQRGYAYETSDGVYFDVSRFPAYGQLSRINLEEQQVGVRQEVKVGEEKRHPADFALWKKAEPNHIMQWDSPWGRGYPGWHIECSAMSSKYLGDTFDIHTGGVDHIPVHHENEIAQAEAATGQKFVNHWLHGEFLLVDGGKMSKHLNNFYTLQQVAQRGFDPLAFRYFCFNAHYRSKLNFTWEALRAAQSALDNLYNLVASLAPPGQVSEEHRERFLAAINDDLGTPEAVAVLWQVVKSPLSSGDKMATVLEFDRVLGLSLDRVKERLALTEAARLLISQRAEARKRKDWARADAIREQLRGLGIELEDTLDGVRWRVRLRLGGQVGERVIKRGEDGSQARATAR